jgi:hypothetical protein
MATHVDVRRIVALSAFVIAALSASGCDALPGMTGSPDVAVEFTPAPPGVQLVPPNDADVEFPPTVRAATVWTLTDEGPAGYSAADRFESPEDLLDAWTDAAAAEIRSFGAHPVIDTQAIGARTDAHAAFIVHVGGIADDSVVGTGYFLVLAGDADGWRLDDLFMRTLCARGADGELCI